ncbi:MAG: Crp/Fnr family transcriptional regulator, partial [Alphaproteobacteria bacterium]|nr:Crp/Fnr family transcriptional regulator [Alphaproteobacteria bacterium]
KIMNLDKFTFFEGSSEGFLKALDENAHIKKCEKGKILFLHEDPAEYFYIIKSGWVKLFRETLDGAQSISDILPEGNIFGETAVFENNIYPHSAETIEPSEIISVPIKLLKDELENNHAFALKILSYMARNRRRQDIEIEHRTVQNASQRIGCFLLRLAKTDHDGTIIIHLPYDKTLIASRLGMQPETFSRALSKLKEKTGIRIKGATIEFDTLEQLISYCCIRCSSEFPCRDILAAE